MNTWKKILILLIFSLSTSAFSNNKTKIESVNFEKNNNMGQITLKLNKALLDTPELTVNPKMIQIAIPEAFVWPKIEKKVSTNGNDFDTTIMAYQFNKNLVRFRVLVPYELKGKENKINLNIDKNAIVLNFPIKETSAKTTGLKKAAKKNKVVKAENYDEGYLNKLLAEKEDIKLNDNFFNSKKVTPSFKKQKDEVSTKMSATEKNNQKATLANSTKSDSFSIGTYVGKFVAFLGLILLFFYGVVHLMKKGVLKKGKLGFLNDTNIVEVLNTTYLGPKKSLLLVKVHKQVFLLSSTEKGLEFLSELNDTTGLLKEGERNISGENFDTSLTTANSNDKTFKLKDMASGLSKYKSKAAEKEISSANEEAQQSKTEGLDSFLANAESEVTDNVKLSDQIKSKMKNLKQFQ